jgi:hypothetical protein
MQTSYHDFVTVDMRGLKAALVANALEQRLSVSALVRQAVGRALEVVDASPNLEMAALREPSPGAMVKLSIRVTRDEAERLDGSARRAGLSRGAFVAGLLDGVPALCEGAGHRLPSITALTASTAELSTLSRNIHQLTALLRRADVQPAQAYRRMLDTLAGDVRAHLMLAASVLAQMRPARAADRATGSRKSAAN